MTQLVSMGTNDVSHTVAIRGSAGDNTAHMNTGYCKIVTWQHTATCCYWIEHRMGFMNILIKISVLTFTTRWFILFGKQHGAGELAEVGVYFKRKSQFYKENCNKLTINWLFGGF